jgi:hypothetical protein
MALTTREAARDFDVTTPDGWNGPTLRRRTVSQPTC